jgi:LemA protein
MMEELEVNKYDKNLKTKGSGCLGATILTGLIFFILIVVSLIAYSYYNGLVEREEKVKSQWAQVENLYQRRSDLIANLVETVKGYAKHENLTLTEVIQARSNSSSIKISPENLTDESIAKFEQSQAELKSSLQRLMVVVEQYPDLKANQSFLQLQSQLTETENIIARERNIFNEVVRDYNTNIRKFPRNIFANLFDFNLKSYFKSDVNAEKVPVVKF